MSQPTNIAALDITISLNLHKTQYLDHIVLNINLEVVIS
jgi:hypothetical protein